MGTLSEGVVGFLVVGGQRLEGDALRKPIHFMGFHQWGEPPKDSNRFLGVV